MSAVEQRSLPKSVDAHKLCQQGIQLEGVLNTGDLPRWRGMDLAKLESLPDDEQAAVPVLNVVLVFGRDDDGHRTLKGSLSGELVLVCQRCMERMRFPLASDFCCALIATDEEAKQLPSHLEPVLLQEGSTHVDLYELLEDELLLNVPMAAMHERCDGGNPPQVFGEISVESEAKRQRPFANLGQLLNKE